MTNLSATGPIVTSPADLVSTLISGLNTDQSNLSSLEQQVSTGLAINQPSDNPNGAASLLQLQASMTRQNQYVTNANDGLGWLQVGNSTMNSIIGVLRNVQSLVEGVSGSDLADGTSGLNSVADSVQSALEELQNLANTTYENGQPIFAGTGSTSEAYDPNGTYQGAGNAPVRTVAPGTQVSVAITGPQVFGTGSSGLLGNSPGNVGVLAQIVQDLQTGTPASVNAVETTDLSSLNSAINQVESAAATLGANQQAVEGFSQQASDTVTTLQTQLGSVQDVNMAQALTNLQLQQTAYQAALYATSQLSTDNLAQYL